MEGARPWAVTCLVAALALVAVLAAGCGGGATSTPSPLPSRTSSHDPLPSRSSSDACTTGAAKGGCGPYDEYSHITGITSSTYIGNNVWNPIPGWKQTLLATSPGNWHVTANMPAGNTAVVSYPSIGANYGAPNGVYLPTPLTNYSSIVSSFSENMNSNSETDAWATYDVWLGIDKCDPSQSTCPTHEVMIQHDFSANANPPCPTAATATFGGSRGVPVRNWNLCKYGTELIWQLPASASEQSGSVDVLSMLTWLVNNGYLPANTALWSIGYGWEICSTGGVNENFQVSRFSITPALSRSASPSPARS